MKISGGGMWNGFKDSNSRFIASLRFVVIPVAWSGAFICTTVFWIFANTWTNLLSVSVTFIFLIAWTAFGFYAFIRYLKVFSTFDLELAIYLSGLLFAIFVGVEVIVPKLDSKVEAITTTNEVGRDQTEK